MDLEGITGNYRALRGKKEKKKELYHSTNPWDFKPVRIFGMGW